MLQSFYGKILREIGNMCEVSSFNAQQNLGYMYMKNSQYCPKVCDKNQISSLELVIPTKTGIFIQQFKVRYLLIVYVLYSFERNMNVVFVPHLKYRLYFTYDKIAENSGLYFFKSNVKFNQSLMKKAADTDKQTDHITIEYCMLRKNCVDGAN